MQKLEMLSDEKIVDLVRNQDKENYAEIINRYEAKLSRYVYYMIKDRDITDDIVQESFIKAYKNLNSFDTKRKFSSWIYRIAHNESIDEIRKRKKILYQPLEVDFWGVFKSKTDIEKELSDKEMGEWLKLCMTELSEKYRSALVLYYFEEKSYEEISDILRISLGTVGTRLNRGKKMIKNICDKKGAKAYV